MSGAPKILDVIRPLEVLLKPTICGLERIPDDRPLLFVGNHQLLALDTPYLMALLWRHSGILLRPLADNFLFSTAAGRRLMDHMGAVAGSPAACSELMQQGECVLVYPGGAREAAKVAGGEYALQWWGRLGFARLALQHRCTIVPVASWGVDDSIRIVVDRDSYLESPLRSLIDGIGLRHDLLPPVFLPKLRPRMHFAIGEPIPMDRFDGLDDETAAERLRSQVAAAIEKELDALAYRPRRQGAKIQ